MNALGDSRLSLAIGLTVLLVVFFLWVIFRNVKQVGRLRSLPHPVWSELGLSAKTGRFFYEPWIFLPMVLLLFVPLEMAKWSLSAGLVVFAVLELIGSLRVRGVWRRHANSLEEDHHQLLQADVRGRLFNTIVCFLLASFAALFIQ
jgi:hypothetical protein